jgi:hypothetical protein
MIIHKSHGKLINNIYYDEAGFGSITSACKEAFHTHKTITLICSKQWFKSNLEPTKQVNGINSFVAPCPYYEYQLDLACSHSYRIKT